MYISNLTELLDWIVAMDFAHYPTDFTPNAKSHWYLKRSPERFTSKELIKIFSGDMDTELRERWNWAVADSRRK